ncbi:MAG: DUF7694 domain-containing protein [Egibacteraceae bacterium]
MIPCTTCSRPGRLAICVECAARYEDTLHPPVPWTKFQDTVPHPDIAAEGFGAGWKNSRYTVWVRRVQSTLGELAHLSIKRNDKNPLHDWRDLQRIKNEILGPEEEACELYPAESRLIDGANQFHLWCFLGMRAPFGYEGPRTVMLPGGLDGSKQRPFEDPPADAMTEEQFQVQLARHKERQFARTALHEQLLALLSAASEKRCAVLAANVGPSPCSDEWPTEIGRWCGSCVARAVKKLNEELKELA